MTGRNQEEREQRKPERERHTDVEAKTVSLRATAEGLQFLMMLSTKNVQLGIHISLLLLT